MKADIPESSLTVGMRTWKNLLEQSIPNAHAPVIGESIKMADIHEPGSTTLNDVFGSSDSSDLTIRCGSDEYNLQRAILCERSAFFAAACDGVFERTTITMQEDDPPTIRRMLTYLHTFAYDDEGDAASIQHYMVNGMEAVTSQALTTSTTPLLAEEPSRAEEQLRHVKLMNNVAVYAVAQKYGIDELKELASAQFCDLLRLKTSSHGVPGLIDAVFGTTSATDLGLRNATVEYCTQHSKRTLADIRVCSRIRHYGELGLDMLQKMLEEKRQLSRQIKQLQGREKVVLSRVQDMTARLLEINPMAESIKILDKSGDISSPSPAQKTLKRLRGGIRQLHNLASVEDWEDTRLATRSPA